MTTTQRTKTHAPVLTIDNHDRDLGQMVYVYPVLSRRANGLSLGINLNPNQACNWRCIYCQVPNLRRGAAPPLNFPLFTQELAHMFERVVAGEFRASNGQPLTLKDVSISGDGEATTSVDFLEVVEYLATVLPPFRQALDLAVPLRLITNGSMLDRPRVQKAIRLIAENSGEIWFKVDGGRAQDILLINSIPIHPTEVIRRLNLCATLCPTWVQSCFFSLDGEPPSEEAIEAYVDLLRAADHSLLRGALLYSIARPSHQPEAPRLTAMKRSDFSPIAQKLRSLGMKVKVTP